MMKTISMGRAQISDHVLERFYHKESDEIIEMEDFSLYYNKFCFSKHQAILAAEWLTVPGNFESLKEDPAWLDRRGKNKVVWLELFSTEDPSRNPYLVNPFGEEEENDSVS